MESRIAVVRGKSARAHLGGIAVSTFYERIQKGLIPPGVPLGGRIVGWPEHELQAILEARIAGATDDDVRQLVRSLIRKRPRRPAAGIGPTSGDAA